MGLSCISRHPVTEESRIITTMDENVVIISTASSHLHLMVALDYALLIVQELGMTVLKPIMVYMTR